MSYSLSFTAAISDIDALGHVNNAVWVSWIQDLATAHWAAAANPAHVAAYVWVVTRHEIDYRGNIGLGESVTGRTWIARPPKGAQFDRNAEFTDNAGKSIVRAKTSWAMIEKTSGRLMRVPPEVAAPFWQY